MMLETPWSNFLSPVSNPQSGGLCTQAPCKEGGTRQGLIIKLHCALQTFTILLASMAVTFLVQSHRFKWELPGSIHDSGFASFAKALLPQFRINVNEAIIRNLSLTLENIAESVAKVIVAQQKSSDSLAKVVLNNRIAPDYLLAEQGGAVAHITFCT